MIICKVTFALDYFSLRDFNDPRAFPSNFVITNFKDERKEKGCKFRLFIDRTFIYFFLGVQILSKEKL